jgi:predicted heme/steroid binding protein
MFVLYKQKENLLFINNHKTLDEIAAKITTPTPSATTPKVVVSTATTSHVVTEAIVQTKSINFFAELPKHNTEKDCWVSYDNHVYDITSLFGQHPGGDQIMVKYCGKDMAQGFDTKEKNPIKTHSETTKSMLSQYLIQ